MQYDLDILQQFSVAIVLALWFFGIDQAALKTLKSYQNLVKKEKPSLVATAPVHGVLQWFPWTQGGGAACFILPRLQERKKQKRVGPFTPGGHLTPLYTSSIDVVGCVIF